MLMGERPIIRVIDLLDKFKYSVAWCIKEPNDDVLITWCSTMDECLKNLEVLWYPIISIEKEGVTICIRTEYMKEDVFNNEVEETDA